MSKIEKIDMLEKAQKRLAEIEKECPFLNFEPNTTYVVEIVELSVKSMIVRTKLKGIFQTVKMAIWNGMNTQFKKLQIGKSDIVSLRAVGKRINNAEIITSSIIVSLWNDKLNRFITELPIDEEHQ